MELREALAMHPAVLPSPDDRRDDRAEADEDDAVAVAVVARSTTPARINGNGVGNGHASTPSDN